MYEKTEGVWLGLAKWRMISILLFLSLRGASSSASTSECPRVMQKLHEIFGLPTPAPRVTTVQDFEVEPFREATGSWSIGATQPGPSEVQGPMTGEQFGEAFPFNATDVSGAQTWVQLVSREGMRRDFQVIGFDEARQEVLLAREEVVSLSEADLRRELVGEVSRPLSPGELIRVRGQSPGEEQQARIVSINDLGSGRVLLLRRMEIRAARSVVQNAQNLGLVSRTSATRMPNASRERARTYRAPAAAIQLLHRATVPRTGRRRVRVLSTGVESRQYPLAAHRADEAVPSTVMRVEVTSSSGRQHTIEVQWPVLSDVEQNEHFSQMAQRLLAELPDEMASVLDRVRFNRTQYAYGVDAAATAGGQREIDFYVRRASDQPFPRLGYPNYYHAFPARMNLSWWHEVGHLAALAAWEEFVPNSPWARAMAADGRSVSTYAQISTVEDFAETFMLYVQNRGGLTDPRLRAWTPNRCAILDELFANTIQRNRLLGLIQRAAGSVRPEVVFVLGVGSAAVGTGLLLYIDAENERAQQRQQPAPTARPR